MFGADEGRFFNGNIASIDSDGDTLADEFDSAAYLAANPDVAAAVGPNLPFQTAYEHYVKFGQFEGRAAQTTSGEALSDAHWLSQPCANCGMIGKGAHHAPREGYGTVTVVNSILLADRRVLWSDAAQIGPDGRLVTIAPNCLDLAGGRLVLAARNLGQDALAFMHAVAEGLPTIDHLARHGGLLFERHLAARMSREDAQTLWLCGWSEALDQALLLQFDPNGPLGQRVSQIRSLVSQPVDLVDRPAIKAVVSGAASPEEVDLQAFGRALAEAQRSYALLAGSDGRFHHGVGGYLLQSEITRTGNHHQIIHNWPDRIGEPIEPFGALAATTYI